MRKAGRGLDRSGMLVMTGVFQPMSSRTNSWRFSSLNISFPLSRRSCRSQSTPWVGGSLAKGVLGRCFGKGLTGLTSSCWGLTVWRGLGATSVCAVLHCRNCLWPVGWADAQCRTHPALQAPDLRGLRGDECGLGGARDAALSRRGWRFVAVDWPSDCSNGSAAPSAARRGR